MNLCPFLPLRRGGNWHLVSSYIMSGGVVTGRVLRKYEAMLTMDVCACVCVRSVRTSRFHNLFSFPVS